MARADFKFHHTLRVRYAEVDAQGVVFNAHYLTYFDVAHTEYMRAAGIDYAAITDVTGIDFHLVKSLVEYRQPIKFDRLIDVWVRCARIGTKSMLNLFEIHAHGEDNLLTTGETVVVCADLKTHKSLPVPSAYTEPLQAFEGRRLVSA